MNQPRVEPAGFGTIGKFVSQVAVLTALLYYFGWVRTSTTLDYFGIETNLLDYSVGDYLLRSVNSALPLVVIGPLITILALAVHRRFVAPRVLRINIRLLYAMRLVASVLGAIVVVGVIIPGASGRLGLALPGLLVVASLLLAYSRHLIAIRTESNSATQWEVGLLAALAGVGVFWFTTLYAANVGSLRAQEIVAGLQGSARVVIYCEQRLTISGPGVTVDSISIDDSMYKFQYRGLELLATTSSSYILLPAGWRRGDANSRLFMVPRETVRLDVAAPV